MISWKNEKQRRNKIENGILFMAPALHIFFFLWFVSLFLCCATKKKEMNKLNDSMESLKV